MKNRYNSVVRKAVIDVGSNSVLLLVQELIDGTWQFVAEDTAVTALGNGTKQTGLLGASGMRDTLAALKRMFEDAQSLGASSVTAAATMAARIATNADEFLARAESQNTPVSILSGEDEARLGFLAVATDPHFGKFKAITIVDPGGHSTEIMMSSKIEGKWETDFLNSYSVGTLGLKTEAIPSESPEASEILAATAIIDARLAEVPPPTGNRPVIVLGASGTNLISIREALTSWQPEKVHGAYLSFEEISRAVGWMMPLTDQERRDIVGMEPGREKTIHLGALILERFLFALNEEGCFVSVRGWRYALFD
ncbi:bifunctional 3-dehydroquinate synthase/phosphatase [soil metagenome]